MSFNKLKEQLASKKRGLDPIKTTTTTIQNNQNEPLIKRFKTKGEIEKEKKEEEQKQKLLEQQEKLKLEKQNNQEKSSPESKVLEDKDKIEPIPFLPKNIVIQRLRVRNQPITYFGETDYIRAERLRVLEENEPIEYTKGENEFANILKQIESDNNKKSKDEKNQNKDNKESSDSENRIELERESHESKEGNIYYFLAKLMWEWDELLEERPKEEKNSRQGRMLQATFIQCKSHIQPLLNSLKSRTLADDILVHIHNIVEFCKQREYIRANDEYLQMAIGNSPWPMGVTMVGIHERSSREKIFSNQVAHVLNDETQRKYIQAVKRLMTFCQTKYPNNPSKNIG